MSILNKLIENLFGWGGIKKEVIFHCADEIVREVLVVGRILEMDLNHQKISFLP